MEDEYEVPSPHEHEIEDAVEKNAMAWRKKSP